MFISFIMQGKSNRTHWTKKLNDAEKKKSPLLTYSHKFFPMNSMNLRHFHINQFISSVASMKHVSFDALIRFSGLDSWSMLYWMAEVKLNFSKTESFIWTLKNSCTSVQTTTIGILHTPKRKSTTTTSKNRLKFCMLKLKFGTSNCYLYCYLLLTLYFLPEIPLFTICSCFGMHIENIAELRQRVQMKNFSLRNVYVAWYAAYEQTLAQNSYCQFL